MGLAIAFVLAAIVVCCHAQPTIGNSPQIAFLKEDERERIPVACITCTSVNPIEAIYLLDVQPDVLCNTCFAVLLLTGTDYCIYYLPSQGFLSFSIQSIYNMTVMCYDGVAQDTQVVQIRLTTNEAPTFVSKTDNVVVNALATNAYDVVYTVTDASDPDGDPVNYTISSVVPVSSTNHYDITISTGIVYATIDLERECEPSVILTITVQDSRHPATPDAKVVTISFGTNYYQVPYIPTINKVINVFEDHALGVQLGPEVQAVPTSPPSTYTFTTFPDTAAALFDIDPTVPATLRLRAKLDYEGGTRAINLSILADNTFCKPEVQFLYINVLDANDPPVISPTVVNRVIYEGNVSVGPFFSKEDEDIGDSVQYNLIADPTGLFSVDPATGAISTPDYDIDAGSGNPTTVTLIVEARDTFGPEASNATVTLTFIDKNDNRPAFPNAFYSYNVEECSALGALPTLVPVDAFDSAYDGNNVVQCVATANDEIELVASCAMFLIGTKPAGQISTITAIATDLGSYPTEQFSFGVPVTVNFLPCTTTVTTTVATTTPATTTTTTPIPTVAGVDGLVDPSAENNDKGTSNITWIVVCCVLGLLCLATLVFVFLKYIKPAFTRRRNRMTPRKVSPPQDNKGKDTKNNLREKFNTPREVRPAEKPRGPDDMRLGPDAGKPNPGNSKYTLHGVNENKASFDL